MIKIDFEFDTTHGKFKDALHLPENHTYSDAEIQEMKQKRLDNWINALENPTIVNDIGSPELPEVAAEIEVYGEKYKLLVDSPLPGAKLIQIQGTWYWRI